MMRKCIDSVLTIAAALFFTNCGNGSSGTAMLDLDVRVMPDSYIMERSNPEEKQKIEDFSNLFTVLPGPYEFTWEELKNQDGETGREQCSTKLKIKLRLNKTLKPFIKSHFSFEEGEPYTDEEMIDIIKRLYKFEMFNSEGKTYMELADENDDHRGLLLEAWLDTIWGIDGKLGHKENKDGILDFYHFLTSKPGTEFDLIIDCTTQLCKDIENKMEYTKGLYIIIGDASRYNFK